MSLSELSTWGAQGRVLSTPSDLLSSLGKICVILKYINLIFYGQGLTASSTLKFKAGPVRELLWKRQWRPQQVPGKKGRRCEDFPQMHMASGRAVQKPGLPRADGHDFLCYGKPMTMIKQVSHPPASLPAVVWVAVVQTARAHLSQGNSATAEPGKALQNHFGVGNTAVSVVP